MIRDDDLNYFTEPEILEETYGDVWKRGTCVYFGVIPFQKGEKSGQVPENFRETDKIFPVGENRKLVEFLKEKIKEKRVEIMLHGYYHKSENGRPEFVAGKNLYERVKKGKEYLEEIFNCDIRFFVPPHNEISREGVKALVKNNMGIFNIPDFFSQPFTSIPDYIRHRIFWAKYKLPYPYPLKFGKNFQIGCIPVYEKRKEKEIEGILNFYKKYKNSTICFAFHWWELKKFSHLQKILFNIIKGER